MEKTGWKILALILLALFILEIIFIFYSIIVAKELEKKTNECYYDVCVDYPDAILNGDVCFCYDYDVLGNLVTSKTKVID